MVLFALALIIGMGWASWKAHCKGRVVLNILLLSTTMILVGFSSYASMTIRAAANPPMNSNNPNNPHALLSVLNRDQYGSRPLLFGCYYSAPPEDVVEKTVHWYLMMADSYYSKPQREEYFVDSGYYIYHEAYHLLKFPNEKQMLERAYDEYQELKKNNLWGSHRYE